MSRFVLCIPEPFKSFATKGWWILSKAFSASNKMIMWFLSLSLFIEWITLMDFHILHHPCIPGMKPTWSWWVIILMCSWIRFAGILLSIFTSIFIREIGLKFSFFVGSKQRYQNNCGFVVSILWNSLRRVGIRSSLKVW